jgi:hypothetical protein
MELKSAIIPKTVSTSYSLQFSAGIKINLTRCFKEIIREFFIRNRIQVDINVYSFSNNHGTLTRLGLLHGDRNLGATLRNDVIPYLESQIDHSSQPFLMGNNPLVDVKRSKKFLSRVCAVKIKMENPQSWLKLNNPFGTDDARLWLKFCGFLSQWNIESQFELKTLLPILFSEHLKNPKSVLSDCKIIQLSADDEEPKKLLKAAVTLKNSCRLSFEMNTLSAKSRQFCKQLIDMLYLHSGGKEDQIIKLMRGVLVLLAFSRIESDYILILSVMKHWNNRLSRLYKVFE